MFSKLQASRLILRSPSTFNHTRCAHNISSCSKYESSSQLSNQDEQPVLKKSRKKRIYVDRETKLYKIAELLPNVRKRFDEGLKPKHSPGSRRFTAKPLPAVLEQAAIKIISKYRNRHYNSAVKDMHNRIRQFPLPLEATEVRQIAKHIEAKEIARDKRNYPDLQSENQDELEEQRRQRVLQGVRARIYNWKEINYTQFEAVVYLGARLAANYAVLSSIFQEISKTDPEFRPKTLFDFGSGIGTTMWAANAAWPASLIEHFNVDCNQPMNDISNLLLKCGDDANPAMYNNVFYRNFLPASNDIKYDLVVSAFSLKELPNQKARVTTIENLWHKTQDMLMLVEHGNRAGFSAILEARNLILQLNGYDPNAIYNPNAQKETGELASDTLTPEAHILAPCPHHYSCPKLQLNPTHRLCNFAVKYWPIDFGQKDYEATEERYSYVVFRKSRQNTNEARWPRIVEHVIRNSGCSICRVCSTDGMLHELSISKSKADKLTYRCAKASRWGDLLPVTIRETTRKEIRSLRSGKTTGDEQQLSNKENSNDEDGEDSEDDEDDDNDEQDDVTNREDEAKSKNHETKD